jgi:radical SAM protein with 4Fe4S-binding SPASM domain
MYPVLKFNVKLKKFTKFCWLYAPENAKDCVVTQYTAFILTLMDGKWKVDELKVIVSTVYDSNEGLCGRLVDEVLADYSDCIELRRERRQAQMRYNPQDFLFNGAPDAIFDQERLDTPNILAMSITRACNFKCVYCFNASEKRLPDELTGAEWCNVIDQARELGVFQVLVTGGEPTLHPDLSSILRKLKGSDIDFKLFTNGGNLSDDLYEILSGARVQVSLDTADRRVHQQLTGVDTFEKVTGNIKRLARCGAQVSVKSVITSLNTSGLPELYRLCQDLGVELLSFDKFDVSSSGRGGIDLRITDKQKEEIRKTCSGFGTPHTRVNLDLSKDTWTAPADAIGCGAFRSSMILSSRGDLIGCEKMIDVPGMTIGNIRQNTLQELWRSPKIDTFISNIRNTADAKCRKCNVFAKCRTGCFATKNYFAKPIFGADPRCEITRA